jgi:hypothetical protein
MGQFWVALVRMEGRRECSDRKIVSPCRERVRRVCYRAVVEVQKEIPVDGRESTFAIAGNSRAAFDTQAHFICSVQWPVACL